MVEEKKRGGRNGVKKLRETNSRERGKGEDLGHTSISQWPQIKKKRDRKEKKGGVEKRKIDTVPFASMNNE